MNSCTELLVDFIFTAITTRGTVYMLTLLMKGRIPTKDDLKKTFFGIIQSTAFLSGTGFGYSLFLCLLRKTFGNYNILTVSAIPVFLSSVFSILIERPSRRILLALYVSNVATETLWNMAKSRNMISSIRYGDVAIYSISMAILSMYFKGGYHKSSDCPDSHDDAMFRVMRFVIGPYEEKGYMRSPSQSNTFYREVHKDDEPSTSSGAGSSRSWQTTRRKNGVYRIVCQMLRVYSRIINKLKSCSRHPSCQHPFSCLYYTIEGAGRMFSLGLGLQVTLKLVLNLKRVLQSPQNIKSILFRKETFNLAMFLGLYNGVFRACLCILRRVRGGDSPVHALPAGILAGMAFSRYPDSTVSLYVLWKVAQITYNLGIDKGILPKVPGFTEFLYCFSTAVLFHAAILEPTNLRPSYWKFLHSISGGRIACMARAPLDVWGLNSSDSLNTVLRVTKTVPIVLF
ncbi:transmembrane protein 135-like isoform X2 [Diabrotica virgifera virgifera]|uniref:Transmembrane protein 135 N-terminal domain-containing protein n=1 Tax=Diabrotica virgifera virgifera TaxID=50390 RepID=A0ABM5KT10_DIAVI|nr:transmembrane protein 135-like isoform X2 [Diabrotica virgifera virgifera]